MTLTASPASNTVFGGWSGACERLRERSPRTRVIMSTAHGSLAAAVEAVKRGAFGCLDKPVDLVELRRMVDKALAHLARRGEPAARPSSAVVYSAHPEVQ